MHFGFELIIIALMLIFTAVLVAYEMALVSLPKARLAALVELKRKGAVEAVYMKDRIEASLAVVQLGVTLVGAIAAATGGAGIAEFVSPYLKETYGVSNQTAYLLSLVFLIIPLSCFTVVFSELLPKTFAINNKVRVCLALSPAMKSTRSEAPRSCTSTGTSWGSPWTSPASWE